MIYQATQDQSGLKAWLADKGILQPDYKIMLQIDESKLPERAISVKWALPRDQFGSGPVVTTNRDENFQIKIDAWKSFNLEAEVELESGEKMKIYNNINPGMAVVK
ncbi:pYEATS domain-containing protein [Zobellella sp. An-6]|uniref:pYEATS domain-containing protein n=1 Tax=Zobellella sp. An-6 TaxID=3400218 RepID=UPI0040413E02